MTFNRSITQAMVMTMQVLSEGIFINMASLTLTQDTLKTLRNSPLYMSSLFPVHVLAMMEVEIVHHEQKRSTSTSHKKPALFHPYTQSGKQAPEANSMPSWKQLKQHGQRKRGWASIYQLVYQ